MPATPPAAAQTMGIPVRRPMPTARAQLLPAQAAPMPQQQSALPRWGYRSLGEWRNSLRDRFRQFNQPGVDMMKKVFPQAKYPNAAWNKTPAVTPAMKKGGNVEKANKLKKPIKKKSFKKADRVKRQAFKEGGAVERFLQKYPDYNPES